LIGDHLNVFTFRHLIDEALAMVPDTVDKRQGAIIYDTLSVGDVQLAEAYIQLRGFYLDTYALTAMGEALDLRVAERGVTRYPATHAVKLGTFVSNDGTPAAIPLGTRFSTTRDVNALIYYASGEYTDPDTGLAVPGSYRMTCETAGAAGNDYIGMIIPVTFINHVATANISDLLIPSRDTEDDEALRARYIELINFPPFGGNVAHYRLWVLEMDGVGAVQIYPIWNGGGTVKVSLIGADFNPASQTLIDDVQTALDPEGNNGLGLGTAPIGHVVTVTTPDVVMIDVTANLVLSGVVMGQVEDQIKNIIGEYLLELRKSFGSAIDLRNYVINVYRARIIAAILSVQGVANVTGLLINGADSDLILIENSGVQQLPMMGTVTLNEV